MTALTDMVDRMRDLVDAGIDLPVVIVPQDEFYALYAELSTMRWDGNTYVRRLDDDVRGVPASPASRWTDEVIRFRSRAFVVYGYVFSQLAPSVMSGTTKASDPSSVRQAAARRQSMVAARAEDYGILRYEGAPPRFEPLFSQWMVEPIPERVSPPSPSNSGGIFRGAAVVDASRVMRSMYPQSRGSSRR